MEEAATTSIHYSMTSTEPKFNLKKMLKFVAENTDFGSSSFFFESLIKLQDSWINRNEIVCNCCLYSVELVYYNSSNF
jgi:hypothetical protein